MHAVCERKEMVEVTENLNLKKNEKAVLSINQLFNWVWRIFVWKKNEEDANPYVCVQIP